MAQISLSKRENDYLREMLICSIRHYTREIEADNTLLSSSDEEGMKELYKDMLRRDSSRLSYAKDLYARLLEVRNDDPDLDYFQYFCNE